MNVVLRRAVLEDAPLVAEVFLSSRKTFIPYASSARTDAEVYRWVSETLIPSGDVTVACDGMSIVGVLATERKADASWINQLYLVPSYVGHGIGARLLDHALQSLSLPLRLYTYQANARARSFYERHGFRAIAFTDGHANEERCPDVLYELANGGVLGDGNFQPNRKLIIPKRP